MNRMGKKSKLIHDLGIWVIVVILLTFFLFPIYWMVLTSLKPFEELFSTSLITFRPSVGNYLLVVLQKHDKASEYWIQMANSFIISLGTVAMALPISTLCAYALSRLKFRLRSVVSYSTLFTYIIPTSFLIIPFFVLMIHYGLVNNLLAVILADGTFATPYCIWVLAEYLNSIPVEIEEAALVDGASRWKIFVSIILPLLAPALVAVATYAFIVGWNEYLYVFVLETNTNKWNVPVAIGSMLTSDDVPWGVMMAMSTIYSIPPVVFYYVFKKYMVAGLIRGAVKT